MLAGAQLFLLRLNQSNNQSICLFQIETTLYTK